MCQRIDHHGLVQSPQKDEVTQRVKQMSMAEGHINGGLVFNPQSNDEIEEEVFHNGTIVDSSSNCNHDNTRTTTATTVLPAVPRKTRKLSEIAKVSVI